MPYKVTSGIPIPPRKVKRAKTDRFPFKKMEVGDSFVIKNFHPDKTPKLLYYHAKRADVKYTTRRLADGSGRVWVTAKTRNPQPPTDPVPTLREVAVTTQHAIEQAEIARFRSRHGDIACDLTDAQCLDIMHNAQQAV